MSAVAQGSQASALIHPQLGAAYRTISAGPHQR